MNAILLTLTLLFSDGTQRTVGPEEAGVYRTYTQCEAAAVEFYLWAEREYPGRLDDLEYLCDGYITPTH